MVTSSNDAGDGAAVAPEMEKKAKEKQEKRWMKRARNERRCILRND
jgi:hypothetical protein